MNRNKVARDVGKIPSNERKRWEKNKQPKREKNDVGKSHNFYVLFILSDSIKKILIYEITQEKIS
jgi:hypothetical protein